MAIDGTGWPLRTNPTRKDSGRRKQQAPRRPLEQRPYEKRNENPNPRSGRIDELA